MFKQALTFSVSVAVMALAACDRGVEKTDAAPPAATGSAASTPPQQNDTNPADTILEWSQDQGVKTYRIGGLQLDLSWTSVDDMDTPVIEVTAPDGTKGRMVGTPGFQRASARFAVSQIVPGGQPEVMMLTYSGGAHCCTTLSILEQYNGAWRVIESEGWDGEGPNVPVDLDGDGRREFSLFDGRFLYAYDAYAGSYPPPRVFRVEDGQFRDVSDEPGFDHVFEEQLPRVRELCEGGQGSANGACPAYVAIAARLGRLDEAWPVMLRSIRANESGWTYPQACRVTTQGQCPDNAQTRYGYAESLQWFLGDTGYIPAGYVEPMNATGPSFSCRRASNAVERAICADPELAAADRELAVSYTRAMVLTADRAGLRREQQRFLAERAGLLNQPGALTERYATRTMALNSASE